LLALNKNIELCQTVSNEIVFFVLSQDGGPNETVFQKTPTSSALPVWPQPFMGAISK